jgi:hypothetical protein
MGGVFDFNTYTFFGCASLASVEIPNSVTNIDKYTFSGCSQLTKVIVPDSVTTMGLGVFNDYTSIEEITLPFLGKNKDDTIYSYIGYAFGASYLGSTGFPKGVRNNVGRILNVLPFGTVPVFKRDVKITGGDNIVC